MRRYDSYKDSGIEWIGEIPNSWNFNKVGNNTYVKGRIGWKGLRSEDFIDEGPFLITGTDFNKDGSINWDNTYHVDQERYDEDPFIQLQDHDVLITKDGTIGKVVYVGNLKGPTCLNSGIFLTRPTKEEYISKYFFWLLNSNIFKVFVDYNSGGSTIQHLYQNVFVNFRFPIPPLPEQQQIVSYLDTKTTLIDSLIEKTYRKIELLKENRTSLIKEVVTKGLNPNVEMKDSGVEWIGEIPSHWERKRLKHITNSINGYSFKSDDFDREFDIPVIRIGDVGDVIDFDDCVKVKSHFLEDKKEFIVKKDDILIGLTGGTIGKSGKYNYDSPSLLNQRVGLLRNKPSVLNGLLYHYVKSEVFIRYIFFDCYGGGQDNISMGDILNMVFPYPPLLEQNEIVSYLDEHTQLIDKTISVEERRIELLKEYRQSLISEVVTGKRKVTTDE
jgi:type I restriction enzyme S subunit